jgi:hypothetical protein
MRQSRTASTLRRLESVESALRPPPPDGPDYGRLTCPQVYRLRDLQQFHKARTLTSDERAEVMRMTKIAYGCAPVASCKGVRRGDGPHHRQEWCMDCPDRPDDKT